MRTLRRTLARTGVLQIDSVNVLQRAHYMPLFSRMGPYDPSCCTGRPSKSPRRDGRVLGARGGVHAGGPLARRCSTGWRAETRSGPRMDGSAAEHRAGRVAAGRGAEPRAPQTARDIEDGRAAGQGALGLELVGDQEGAGVAVLRRRGRRRRAQLGLRAGLRPARAGASRPSPRRCPTPTDDEAAPSWSVGLPRSRTASAPTQCLRDYYRLERRADWSPAIADAGRGGRAAARSRSRAGSGRPTCIAMPQLPARSRRGALLSPFDPLIWERDSDRGELFDFHYRIEIYVPEPTSGSTATTCCRSCSVTGSSAGSTSRPTARRACCACIGAWREPRAPDDTPERLWAELPALAGWLGLDGVSVAPKRRSGARARPTCARAA